MVENKHDSSQPQLSSTDALVAGIKYFQSKQKQEGTTPFPTPVIDRYIEDKKQEVKR